MIFEPIRILFFLASLILVALGISKLGDAEIDLGAVGIEELDNIPPPPPPVDVVLDKPTIIGFLPDSLRLDSLKEALGRRNFTLSWMTMCGIRIYWRWR